MIVWLGNLCLFPTSVHFSDVEHAVSNTGFMLCECYYSSFSCSQYAACQTQTVKIPLLQIYIDQCLCFGCKYGCGCGGGGEVSCGEVGMFVSYRADIGR